MKNPIAPPTPISCEQCWRERQTITLCTQRYTRLLPHLYESRRSIEVIVCEACARTLDRMPHRPLKSPLLKWVVVIRGFARTDPITYGSRAGELYAFSSKYPEALLRVREVHTIALFTNPEAAQAAGDACHFTCQTFTVRLATFEEQQLGATVAQQEWYPCQGLEDLWG